MTSYAIRPAVYANTVGRAALFDVRALPAWRIVLVMLAVSAALGLWLDFDYVGTDLNLLVATGGYLMAFAMVLRRIGVARLATMTEALVITMASIVAVSCLSLVLARSGAPLADRWLDAADRFLLPELAWSTVFDAVRVSPGAVRLAETIYQTLLWQPFALVALLALGGRHAFAWRFVHAWALALAICATVFALVPALGAYALHDIRAVDIPDLTVATGWRQPEVLIAVRNGVLHSFDPAQMTGIIAFPSFHAAAAVLLGWGYARIRWLAPPLVALNVLMGMSAIVVGAHYFVDIMAGVGTALIAIRLSRPRLNTRD